MANALFEKGRQKFLEGSILWLTDNIKCILVNGYTVNLSLHEFLSDVPGGNITATSPNLATKTSTGGVADAADVTFSAVVGPASQQVIIYKDTGSAATSPLIAYIDTALGLPVTPGGGDIIVQWDNGANRIFKL